MLKKLLFPSLLFALLAFSSTSSKSYTASQKSFKAIDDCVIAGQVAYYRAFSRVYNINEPSSLADADRAGLTAYFSAYTDCLIWGY